jgi:hypothetical protein
MADPPESGYERQSSDNGQGGFVFPLGWNSVFASLCDIFQIFIRLIRHPSVWLDFIFLAASLA